MTREELMQNAKPILFNTDMVRAILDGRKTVTRRIIKPQPEMILCYAFAGHGCGKWMYPDKNAFNYWGEEYKRTVEITPEDEKRLWTPPCCTDDTLYVRETCAQAAAHTFFYRADKTIQNILWRPSIHMPKEAARIFLKVKDVRVERLQEMSDDDCEKEGLENFCKKCSALFSNCDTCLNDGGINEDFKELWNSTIKKSDLDRYGWDANPWVWVIEFERIRV